ncbi:MAG: hypothetical protein ACRCXZ_04470 [Patescibacteria group bacterium]
MSSNRTSWSITGVIGLFWLLGLFGDLLFIVMRFPGNTAKDSTVQIMEYKDSNDNKFRAKFKLNDGKIVETEYNMLDAEYLEEARLYYKSKPDQKYCATLLYPNTASNDPNQVIQISSIYEGPCKK